MRCHFTNALLAALSFLLATRSTAICFIKVNVLENASGHTRESEHAGPASQVCTLDLSECYHISLA